MKNQRKIIISLAALVIAIAAMFGIYQFTKPSSTAGEKNIIVEVVHKDETVKSFEYHTQQEFLGDVLVDEALVEGENGAYGLFITSVDRFQSGMVVYHQRRRPGEYLSRPNPHCRWRQI